MWNKILKWSTDFKERQIVLKDFNKEAKNKFVRKETGILLEAKTTIGYSNFEHAFSRIWASGFNVKVFSTEPLAADQVRSIGVELTKDETFVRKLISLGWDTLEVEDSETMYCYRWELKKYVNKMK